MAEQPHTGRSILRSLARNPFVRALAILAVALIGGLVLRSRLKPIDVVMVFLLAVVLVAARLGRGPAVMSVALATLLFDFFFVPPYGTLSVLDGSYWFTFGAMFVVAMIMTELTATIREQALDAQHGERRASALYQMFRHLAEAPELEQQRALIGRYLGRVVDGEAEVAFVEHADEAGETPRWIPAEVLADLELRAVANWSRLHREPAGWGTTHAAETDAVLLPLVSDDRTIGVAVVRPGSLDRVLEDHELKTLEVLARQAAVALDQAHVTGGAPWSAGPAALTPRS